MAAKGNNRTHSIRTLGELAKLVDRDTGTVSRWSKREDWPFARKAPWSRSDVPKILRWVADTLERDTRPDRTGGEPKDESKKLRLEKLREEVRKLRANADQAETALAKERGQLIDAAETEREWASVGVMIRNGFANLASQIVPLALSHGMPGESAAVLQNQIEEAVNAILRRLSSDSEPEDSEDGTAQAA